MDQFRQFVAFFNDDGRRSRGGCGLFRGVQLVQCQHKGGGFPVTADKVIHLLDHPINQSMENGVVLALVVEDLGGVLLCLFVVGVVAVVKAAVLCRVEGIELVKVDLCGLALCGQLLVIGDDLSGGAEPASGGGLAVLHLQAAEQVGLCRVVMRIGGGFLAFGLCRFPLGLAGLRGVLPQVAFNQCLFVELDALAFLLPVVEGVQLAGCQHDLRVVGGAGVLGAVVLSHGDLSGQGFDLGGGVVCGGDGVQGDGVELRGFVQNDLFVRHGTCSFSCCGWCSG